MKSLGNFDADTVKLAQKVFDENRFVDLAMFRQKFESILNVGGWELYEPFLATHLPYYFDMPMLHYEYNEDPDFYRNLIIGLKLSGIFSYYMSDHGGGHRFLSSKESELVIFRLAISGH